MSNAWRRIFLKAAIIIAAKHAFGSFSNKGPRKRMTTSRTKPQKMPLSIDLPPAVSITLLLDKEPELG